jgi:hypothetical protein
MATNNPSNKSQWPLDWFITQALTTKKSTSSNTLDMCQVKGGGTLPNILTMVAC